MSDYDFWTCTQSISFWSKFNHSFLNIFQSIKNIRNSIHENWMHFSSFVHISADKSANVMIKVNCNRSKIVCISTISSTLVTNCGIRWWWPEVKHHTPQLGDWTINKQIFCRATVHINKKQTNIKSIKMEPKWIFLRCRWNGVKLQNAN